MVFDANYASLIGFVYLAYYYLLEPAAAVSPHHILSQRPKMSQYPNYQLLYTPQMVATVLTATAFSYKPECTTQAALLHVFCWVAQFIGHGVAEGRAPALLDNLIGGRASVFVPPLT
jgi:uncharacterized membrane protein YGL010W